MNFIFYVLTLRNHLKMDKINVSAKAIGLNGAQFNQDYKGATLFRARQDTA